MSQPEKKSLIEKYKTHDKDTGSVEVQIALLSQRVGELSKHLESHKKDFDSKKGLLIIVGKRRRLLSYLKKSNSKKYEKVIKDLGLRK